MVIACKGVPRIYGDLGHRDTLIVVRPDGSIDEGFAPTRIPVGDIEAMVTQPDGKIVVGGSFQTFNNSPCDFIVRLLPDGTRDSSFSAKADDVVRALALQSDGRILLGGDFLTVDDVPRARVARVQSNGQIDPTFAPQFDLNGSPTLLRLQPDGRIFVSGNPDGGIDAT